MCEEFEVISHGNMDYNIFLNNLLYRTPHVHKEFEVCLLLDGSVQLLSPSSSRAFSAGSLWVINPFESHELIAERPALILSLQIAPAFFSGIFPQMENIEFSISPAPHPRLGSLRPERSAAPEHMTQFQGGRADVSIYKMRAK